MNIMHFNEVGSLLDLNVNGSEVYYIDKQQKKYNIENKILYEKTFEVLEPLKIYKQYIINCKFDRSLGKIFKDCTKCDSKIFNYIMFIETNRYIHICIKCNHIEY